jgi:NADH dehydrogenase
MTLQPKTVTIFGGTGFIGGQIVRELARQGFLVKIATRVPERAYDLKPCGHVGQIVAVACDYDEAADIRAAVADSTYVVNCIGSLTQRRGSAFRKLYTDVPRLIAEACRDLGVERFVHISALGTDKGKSRYAVNKREGEGAVRATFPVATILRPSVVFGADDNFFNKFARLARYVPVMPLIGGGRTKMQPVYVGDVAGAVMAALLLPAGTSADPRGRVFELGGPGIVDFRQIYRMMFDYTGRRRMMLPVPFWLMKLNAFFLSLLPEPILTPDQVETLKTDSVVESSALSLRDLGLNATAMEIIVPGYLAKFRSGGPFRALQETGQ